jgi:hypothetical protein
MHKQKTSPTASLPAEEICFGLNRESDERSLAAFIEKFADPAFLQTLIARLDDTEITATLDFLSSLMHKHISEEEYHRLFLGERP